MITLDYGGLTMVADTRLEREVRAKSAAKEQETVAFIEAIPPGDCLWDIGANVGAYTLIAASRGVRVVAVEPSPANYHHLTRNVALNALDVLCLPVALDRATGTTRLDATPDEAGATHSTGMGNTGIEVLSFGLDLLVQAHRLPRPDWLKIDVDGGEVDVLSAARFSLLSVKGLLVEVCDATVAGVTDLLEGKHFRLCGAHLHARSGVTNLVWSNSRYR